MLYVAFSVFIFSTLQMALFAVFAENISHRIKIMYFRRVLEKDATWFDSNNPSELSSKIANECSAIQRATGDKISNILQGISSTVCGFTFAFVWGWKLSLILLVGLPVLGIAGITILTQMGKGVVENMKAYA